jgi:arginyl-tRNA synthetase
VLRKAEGAVTGYGLQVTGLDPRELTLIQRLCEYPSIVRTAGDEFSPAVLCNYAYALACDFNSFYHDLSILNEPDAGKRALRLLLAKNVAKVLRSSMAMLGIEMPERM